MHDPRVIRFFSTNYDVPAFSPFSDPRLNAKPWERLRIRTNPVIGPFSPSFSMLKFANASSPAPPSAFLRHRNEDRAPDLPKTLLAYKLALKN